MPLLSRLMLALGAGLLFAVPGAAQSNCFFSISPSNASFTASEGTGLVTVVGAGSNAATCRWTAASNASWITISFGQDPGSPSGGSAGYRVARNNTPSSRTGTVTVAGQTVTITQAAGSCNVQLSPTRATVPTSGGNGRFDVVTECSWTAVTTATWITLGNASGTGSGAVDWSAAANTGTTSRTGTITVGSASYTITQDAATPTCVFNVSPSSFSIAAAGGTGSINVTGSSTCSRTAVPSVPWITITGGDEDTGNGTVTFSVAANPGRDLRTGTITIGTTPVTISQAGNTCTYAVNPPRGQALQPGGAGTFAVTTSSACSWTAVSKTDWLHIANGTGTGSGSVTYEYGANYTSMARSGFIDVGGVIFVLEQPGMGCGVTVEPSALVIGAEATTGVIRVTTLSDCSWTATSGADWIRLTGRTSGTGNGEVGYEIPANPTVTTRTGSFTIGGQVVTVRQAAGNCNVSIGATTFSAPAAGATGSLAVTANCAWRAIASADWIRITSPATGSTDATVAFTVAANAGSDERRGSIVVNGKTFAITQAGQRCAVTLSSTSATLPGRGGSGSVSVTGSSACVWSAISNAEWLRVQWSSVGGSGSVRFSADPNTTGVDRTGAVSVSGQTVTVVQSPLAIQFTAAGVANGASFATGGVAPGEIITIFGTGFGPSVAAIGGGITTEVGSTRVLFDGVPAPMVYVVEGQLSAIVPYAVAGKQTTRVEVEYFGLKSPAMTVPVVPAAPGIFTASASGSGQAAVLNQDYSVNGVANPAARGSVVQIFATGEGQTRPEGVDGKLAAEPLPRPVLDVAVTIGGVPAQVLYAGGAPGLVAGVVQINAVVPAGVTPGAEVPVVVRVGEASSKAGPVIAVR